jgi:hypothetical protein
MKVDLKTKTVRNDLHLNVLFLAGKVVKKNKKNIDDPYGQIDGKVKVRSNEMTVTS